MQKDFHMVAGWIESLTLGLFSSFFKASMARLLITLEVEKRFDFSEIFWFQGNCLVFMASRLGSELPQSGSTTV